MTRPAIDGQKRPSTYVNEPLDTGKEIRGKSRKPSDAPSEIQQKCIDIIIGEGRNRNMSVRDIAYYIAIAKRESGFNPDAANARSTASGISQMQVETGKKYGINDQNRFDARTSIRAGLDFFLDLKKRLKRDYGRTDGEYEPLIYFLYHYGEFYHYRDRINAKYPYSLSELMEKYKAKYEDSATVVHQAVAFEKILNGSHALQIQLRDVMGKPMHERKVLVLVPKQEKARQPDSATVSRVESTSSNTSISNSESPFQAGPDNKFPSEIPPTESTGSSQDSIAGEESGLNFEVKVYTTDAEGNIPEIETSSEQPLLVLVPRPNYEEYAETVIKGDIVEESQPHELLPRDETASSESTPTMQESVVDSTVKQPVGPENISNQHMSLPAEPTSEKSIASTQTTSHTGANIASQKQSSIPSTASTAVAPSVPKIELDWNDVKRACDSIGWECVRSGFVYAKQFFTKPKLPETPFSDGRPRPGNTRVQSISSSLKVAQAKAFTKKNSLLTEEKTAEKDFKADETTPWMDIALAEQSKMFSEKRGRYQEDTKWKMLEAERKKIEKSNDKLKKGLAASAKLKSANTAATMTINQEIETNSKRIEEIRLEQEKIVPLYEEVEILKYFAATSLKAGNDEVAWCSAFVNWVLKQAGYHHTKNALASSWLTYGDACSPPKYGAIIVVQKTGNGESNAESTTGLHVGFFVAQSEHTRKEKNANGLIEEKVTTKWKILGGNQGKAGRITEVNFESTNYSVRALRWPTH